MNFKLGFPALVLALASLAPAAAWAQAKPASPASRAGNAAAPPRAGAELDAPLFYQLLIGELELQSGRANVATEVMLDAARRTKSDDLFERAIEIALQARAGEQALLVVKSWRTNMPASTMALRYHAQILAALGKPAEAAEPVRSWLAKASAAERLSILVSLPRIFVRGEGAAAAAQMIEDAVLPYAAEGKTEQPRDVAFSAAGRAWLMAGDSTKALSFAQQALKADAKSTGALLLALELAPRAPQADALVNQALQQPDIEPAVRLAYVRNLTQQQRLGEALSQLGIVTQQLPKAAGPWMTVGAIELELKHPQQAETALNRYLELVAAEEAGQVDPDAEEGGRDGRVQARLMLAQAAEMRKDYAAAEKQLALIDSPAHAADVQARRAAVLVRQGRWRDARELVRKLPSANPEQARRRTMAELTVLRDARQWSEANKVLDDALKATPNDADLLYEQAMMAEKLNKLDVMERLLRQVIQLKPEHQHAYNALGYSLADRGLRLDEADGLIQRALALSPGDPFITDSLAWVKFRQGLHQEALTLLTQAYKSRPDTEIAAHLGEVLWTVGQKDEAKRIWGEGQRRDADNDVLQETLKRLKPGL